MRNVSATASSSGRWPALVAAVALVAGDVACASRGKTPAASTVTQRSAALERTLSADAQRQRLQAVVDAYVAANRFPGAVLAARTSDGRVVSVAAGFADRERRSPMSPASRMLAGSVGKTFFAALALQLVGEGKLNLDTPILYYLREDPRLARVPNANRVTVRMLLNHTSGYPSYDEAFMTNLAREPLRERDHGELLDALFRNVPLAAPGERFAYSDLNYVLLATLMESVVHGPACGQIQRRLLDVLDLHDTSPAKSPRIAGLVPGYAGRANPFGGDLIMRDGALVLNPQFEWAGGGYVSTSADLARWMAAFCEGRAFPRRLWQDVIAGIDAPSIGPGSRYGLGLVAQPTRAGIAYGHGGYFPGYVSWVRYYPDAAATVAIQVNSSDDDAFSRGLRDALDDAVAALPGI
jgi:D-alanyl-D-alanine carboxypeptidase